MGGNLFKLGRLARNEYLEIEKEICRYLDQKIGKFYRIPRYYGNKADFGDIDIIISSDAIKVNWENFRKEVIQDLNLTEYKSAGSVFSTVYRNFQVDYFPATARYFESTYNFMSFNDVGNILGKIYRRFNLKYGEKGLAYVYRRENGHYKTDLEISTDFQKISAFIGLDYRQWLKGFDSLEEVFEWAIASPYFSVNPYQELAGDMEKRAEIRTTIQKFLEYLEKNNIQKTYQYLENKDDYLPFIAESFPEAKILEQIKEEKEKEKKAIEINAKFNGKIVMALIPELEGKVLGNFILNFKNQFDDFEKYIEENNKTRIEEDILNFYQIFTSFQ